MHTLSTQSIDNRTSQELSNLKECSAHEPIAHLQAQFKEQGYLFIRSFFPASEILQIKARVVEALEKEGWGKFQGERFIAIEPVNRINSPAFHRCIAQIMKEESLHDLSQSPLILTFLSALLGETVYSHPRKMMRITYPYHLNPKDRIPPHQDLFYVKGERDTFTAWIPLGEYPPEHGGLLVSPKTHKEGLFPTESSAEGRFGCNAVEKNIKEFTWCKAHYRPGDLLLMHSLTLHQAGINETDQFRLSLDCRYSSITKSINADQLLPPYFPDVPDWNQLSKNWKNPDRFKVPTTLKILPKEQSLHEVMLTPSQFC